MNRSAWERIEVDSRIMMGIPVVKGTLLPVDVIVSKLAYGQSKKEILKDYPYLEEEDLEAVIAYAAEWPGYYQQGLHAVK